MDGSPATIERPSLQGIFDSLRNLETRLLAMAQEAAAQTGREPGADQFVGLYVSEADVFRYPNDPASLTGAGSGAQPLAVARSFAVLGEIYGLSRAELDTLLIALAPEIDPRYERIFAYLRDPADAVAGVAIGGRTAWRPSHAYNRTSPARRRCL